jgi:uncharacterized membrane protein
MSVVAIIVWALFFLTTVYGHIGLKIAVTQPTTGVIATLAQLGSAWGVSALLAWLCSALLWAFLLKDHTFFSANGISSLRYVLLCLAGVLCFQERLNSVQALGMLLICTGIFLVKGVES